MRRLAAEVLGTFALVFAGTGAVVINDVMACFASATSIPFRKPEFTSFPVATSVKAASFTSTGPALLSTTWMMGMLNFFANSQSLSSWPGTAMMAPVP